MVIHRWIRSGNHQFHPFLWNWNIPFCCGTAKWRIALVVNPTCTFSNMGEQEEEVTLTCIVYMNLNDVNIETWIAYYLYTSINLILWYFFNQKSQLWMFLDFVITEFYQMKMLHMLSHDGCQNQDVMLGHQKEVHCWRHCSWDGTYSSGKCIVQC